MDITCLCMYSNNSICLCGFYNCYIYAEENCLFHFKRERRVKYIIKKKGILVIQRGTKILLKLAISDRKNNKHHNKFADELLDLVMKYYPVVIPLNKVKLSHNPSKEGRVEK